MKIQNETKTRTIELTVVDSEENYYPSYRLRIGLATEEFQAEFNREIWISKVDLENFVARLESLENSRKGDEKLKSMSPDEFHLRFRNLDNLGHLAVELELKKDSKNDNSYSDLLRVEFEIDPTSLPEVMRGMNELKTQGNTKK